MKRYNDLLNRYNVLANCYNDSETIITVQKTVQRVRGYEGAGTGVRIRAADTTGFFQKNLTGPSQIRTRLPAYTRTRYEYRGYRARIHGYRLYPTGFSKPLIEPHSYIFCLRPVCFCASFVGENSSHFVFL
jgi:hypothetical protein